MKPAAIILIVLSIALIAGFSYFYAQKPVIAPSPSPVPTNSPVLQSPSSASTPIVSASGSISYCAPSQLDGEITTDAAAGNIYGTVTLKNISKSSCQIFGNNFLTAKIPASVTNITSSHSTQPTHATFTLSPGDSIYSQVHFPNGPQCQGPTKQQNIEFTYQISQNDIASFKTTSGTTVPVQACAGVDKTNIDIWAWSSNPITP